MNFVTKTFNDLFRDNNYRYFSGVIARMKKIGFFFVLKEIYEYNKKYVWLPRKIGKRGDLKYTMFVFYNYFKIVYIFPNIEKDKLLDFFPTRFQRFFLYDLDPKVDKVITFNKLLFYKKLIEDNIAHPLTYGYLKEGKMFNFNGQVLTESEFQLLPDKLFVKPYEANGGVNAGVFSKEKLTSLNGDLLFQRIQTNHPEIIRLSGKFAFNTVRIITYIDNQKELHLLSAIFRISNGKIVDNWGQGSINVQIDIKRGKLVGEGITKYNERFTHYPTTGIALDGFQLPMWQDFLELVNKACYNFSNLRLIAWDIGFSETKPVIIEANSGCDFFHAQLFKTYYQTPLIQDLLLENLKKN